MFPEYYILCVRDFNNSVKDDLDEWMYYFKNTEILDHFRALGKELLLYDRLSKEERSAYDHHLSQTRYEQNVVEDSFASGQMKGQAAGEAIGLEKGSVQTLERIVLSSTNIGLSLSQIESITKLSSEQIISILKQHGVAIHF